MTLAKRDTGKATEWPTVLLAVVIYGGWIALTWCHARLPLWALVPIGAWLVAWHGSLQHEIIHGHPTRYTWLNTLIAGPALALWLPYRSYRRDHIAHHATHQITHPFADSESRYLADDGRAITALRKIAATAQATLAGRLVLGPVLEIAGFFTSEVLRLRREPAEVVRDWVPHLLGVALIVAWLQFCGMSIALYIIAVVYPATALSLLRSYAEHRAAEDPAHRVAIVENAGPLALLYLNNNLHAAHHRAPGVSWFRLPRFYRAHRGEILARNGGLLYGGYGEIVRRFWRRPHDRVVHPEWA
jgi:fatty acid desaturase